MSFSRIASPNSDARATSSGRRVSSPSSRRTTYSPSRPTRICSSSRRTSRSAGSGNSVIALLLVHDEAARHSGDRVPLGRLLQVVGDERLELAHRADLALDEIAAAPATGGDVADADDAEDPLAAQGALAAADRVARELDRLVRHAGGH